MMKLFKYDYKSNANTFLWITALLIIVQVIVSVTAQMKNWDLDALTVLSVLLYMGVGITLIVMVCKTYSQNLKAYHRRLLPIHPVWTILSPILLGILATSSILVIALIHFVLFLNYVDLPVTLNISDIGWLNIALIIFYAVWMITFFMVTVILSITIGASVRIGGKAAAWIGVLSYFVIQFVVSWIEGKLFNGVVNSPQIGSINLDTGVINSNVLSELSLSHYGMWIYEFAVMALMVYTASVLLRKKVEI